MFRFTIRELVLLTLVVVNGGGASTSRGYAAPVPKATGPVSQKASPDEN
jgi:hypothetical protein